MARKKVFVSYDHSEDAHYKRLLEAWDANTNFEFTFDSRSPSEAIDSNNASTIKSALTTKMKSADYLLVIVGKKTSTSKWDRAKQPDTKLKLGAVKIDKNYTSPSGLLNTGTAWAMSFTQDGIISALSQATNKY